MHRYAAVWCERCDSSDARDAIRGRDGYEMGGCRIRVELTRGVGPRCPGGQPLYEREYRDQKRSSGHGSPESGYRVVVSGLPASGSWQDLKDHMWKAGEISNADVFKDGRGVVEYTRYEDLKYAIKILDDTRFKSYEGDTSYIRVKQASSRCRSQSRNRSRSGAYSPHFGASHYSRQSSESCSPSYGRRASPRYSYSPLMNNRLFEKAESLHKRQYRLWISIENETIFDLRLCAESARFNAISNRFYNDQQFV